MKKKTFLAMTLCAAVLALTLAGCGSDKPDNDNTSNSVSVSDSSDSGDSSSSDEQSGESAGDLTVYNENGLEFSYPSSWMKTNTNTAAGDTIVVMPEDSAGDSVAVMVQDLGTKVPAVKDYINATLPMLQAQYADAEVTGEEYDGTQKDTAVFSLTGTLQGMDMTMVQYHILNGTKLVAVSYSTPAGVEPTIDDATVKAIVDSLKIA